jgi:hypothetical protein
MSEAKYNPVTNSYETGPGSSSDVAYSADGAISHAAGVHALTKPTGALAMTLSNPLDSEENTRMVIISRTAFAHAVTVASGYVIHFAVVGDCIDLIASNLRWVPVSAPHGATIT